MDLKGSGKQQRWNQRYKDKQGILVQPAAVLKQNQSLLSNFGEALDLACGLGGNAVYLAEFGYDVTALDFSEIALDKLASYAKQNSLQIKTQQCDLEQQSLESHQYDIIVVSYYLQRDLFPELFKRLKQGGLLFYQTFGVATENADGPSNPLFRLTKGELLLLCKGLSVVYYREDQGSCVGENCYNNDAMIVAKKD